jgi:hypothetical protein
MEKPFTQIIVEMYFPIYCRGCHMFYQRVSIKSSQVLIETVLFIEQKPLLLARIHDSAQGQIGEVPVKTFNPHLWK